MTRLKNRCAIVGVGETALGKLPTMSSIAIQLEAIRLAVKDAQLRPADIDGLLAIQPADDPRRSYALSIAGGGHPTKLCHGSGVGRRYSRCDGHACGHGDFCWAMRSRRMCVGP